MNDRVFIKNSNTLIGNDIYFPSVDEVDYGELLLNYHTDRETLFIKNDTDKFVSFKSKKHTLNTINDKVPVVTVSETAPERPKEGDIWIEPIVPNFIGTFASSSVETNWFWYPNYTGTSMPTNSDKVMINVDSTTKEFNETYDVYLNSCQDMFNSCSYLETLTKMPDISYVFSMLRMFYNCTGLTSLNLNNWNTSNVTNMQQMFQYCKNLSSLDLSKFNTFNVTTMNTMFSGCSGLISLDVSSFNTSNVTNMAVMFRDCSGLTTLDLSHWNTSKVTNMSYMFAYCPNLISLDLSIFDTSKVTDARWMFQNSSKLSQITCKQAFKDWCWEKQDTIMLPDSLKSGGSGTWTII